MNESDVELVAAVERPAWQQAEQAERSGDLLQAAALYLACPPLPGRGAAPAHFHAGWCYERAGRLLEAGDHYENAVSQSSDPALTIEALYRLAWLALDARDNARASPRLQRLLGIADRSAIDNATVAHARYWFAACCEQDGELLSAADQYAAIVAAGRPDLWPEAAYRRLLCLSLIGDFDAALRAADALLHPAAEATDTLRLKELQALAREERTQILRARAIA